MGLKFRRETRSGARYQRVISMEMRIDGLTPKAVETEPQPSLPLGRSDKQTATLSPLM